MQEGNGGEIALLFEEWPASLISLNSLDEQQNMARVYRDIIRPDIAVLRKTISRLCKSESSRQESIDRIVDTTKVCELICGITLGGQDDRIEPVVDDHNKGHDQRVRWGLNRVPHIESPQCSPQDTSFRSDRERYQFLVKKIYPQMAIWNNTSDHSLRALKELKRHLTPLAVVDPCVHSFTKPDYLRRKDIIYSSLYLELGLERKGFQQDNSQVRAPIMEGQLDLQAWHWPAQCDEEFFLLYRGTRSLRHDSSVRQLGNATPSNPAGAHSLSYGLGLFAGVMQDTSATPFNYMRKRGMEAYAIKILRREYKAHDSSLGAHDKANTLAERLFFVPPLPTSAALKGLGELFHPRSKVCIDLCHSVTATDAEGASTHHPNPLPAKRSFFVSGILSCSYASLPEFLTTEPASVASFSLFLDSRTHLLEANWS